jgi:hypothetical protein
MRRGLTAAVVAVVALLVAAGTALAGQDQLKGGSVVIQLKGSGGLKLRPGTLKLPITGGAVDPVDGSGTVQVSGSFKAKRGKGKAKVTITALNLGANGGPGTISAKIGKKRVAAFGKLAGGSVARDGWGAKISNITAKLAVKGAQALNRAFSPGKGAKKSAGGGVKAGQSLGTVASVTTDPRSVEVVPGSGTMTLATDSGLVSKLLAHCIDGLPTASPPGVSPIAPATESLTGAFTFPVSGGAVAPDFSAGTLITDGGQTIAKNNDLLVTTTNPSCSSAEPPVGTSLVSRNFQTQFDNNALATNTTLPTGFTLLATLGAIDFSAGSRSIDPNTKDLTVTGATVKLTDLTAATLNQIFPNQSGNASNDFAGGDSLGTLSMTAKLR